MRPQSNTNTGVSEGKTRQAVRGRASEHRDHRKLKLERVGYPGDRHIYYRVRPEGWNRAVAARLRTVTHLRELADRALASAGGGRHERLQEMRDVYAWFEDRIEELLAKRRVEQ